MDGENVYIVNPETGKRGYVPRAELETWSKAGYQPESAEATEDARLQEEYGNSGGLAFAEGAARGLSFGLSDVALGQLDEEGVRERRERNRGAALTGEVGGALLPLGAGGLISGAGRAVEGAVAAGEGAGLLGRAAPIVARGATEGALFGAGQGVSEVALSHDPLTAEGAIAAIGSNALFGGVVGAGAGVAGKLLEEGAVAGRRAANKVVSRLSNAAEEAPAIARASEEAGNAIGDVAGMDRKALRSAEKTEVTRIRGELAEREAKPVLEQLRSFSEDTRSSFVAAEDASVGARLGRTKKQVMKSLDDPKGWVSEPFQMRGTAKALRIQEQALNEALESGTLSESGQTAAREWLGKNVAMQDRLGQLSEALATPTSARLGAIQDAIAGVAGKAPKSFIGSSVEKAAGGAAAGLAFSAGLGVLAPLAYEAGTKAGAALVEGSLAKLTGQLAAGARSSTKKLAAGVDRFFGAAEAGTKAVTRPLATKVLGSVSYASPDVAKAAARPVAKTSNPRVKLFRERARELEAMTEFGPDGKPHMKMAQRAALNDRLGGVFSVAPKLADEMESTAARRLEFMADKLPRRPGPPQFQTGPDSWQPSEMQMAKFARYADAVEHPENVMHRMADGTMTPEDAEALKVVYPKLYQEAHDQIMARLPQLQKTLPYKQRLMMSIFFDAPVDPAMEPAVFNTLQGNFANEPQTQGGTQPPTSRFASLSGKSAPAPTSAQRIASK